MASGCGVWPVKMATKAATDPRHSRMADLAVLAVLATLHPPKAATTLP